MNVRTDRKTDRQATRTSRLCGARSGSPQLFQVHIQLHCVLFNATGAEIANMVSTLNSPYYYLYDCDL